MSFANWQVADKWAKQASEKASNHTKSLHFEGPTLWTYRTRLAVIIGETAIINMRRYSVTSSIHRGRVISAAHGQGLKIVEVADEQALPRPGMLEVFL